jgi:hypothetical protein
MVIVVGVKISPGDKYRRERAQAFDLGGGVDNGAHPVPVARRRCWIGISLELIKLVTPSPSASRCGIIQQRIQTIGDFPGIRHPIVIIVCILIVTRSVAVVVRPFTGIVGERSRTSGTLSPSTSVLEDLSTLTVVLAMEVLPSLSVTVRLNVKVSPLSRQREP